MRWMRRVSLRLWAYIRPMNLIITTADGKQHKVRIPEGSDPDKELEMFQNREAGYARNWIPVVYPESMDVQYAQITSVKIG